MNTIQKTILFYCALYITCGHYVIAGGEDEAAVDPVEEAMAEEKAKVAAEPRKEEDRRNAKWEVNDAGLERWDHFKVLDPLESGFNNEGGFGHGGNVHYIEKRVLPVLPFAPLLPEEKIA